MIEPALVIVSALWAIVNRDLIKGVLTYAASYR